MPVHLSTTRKYNYREHEVDESVSANEISDSKAEADTYVGHILCLYFLFNLLLFNWSHHPSSHSSTHFFFFFLNWCLPLFIPVLVAEISSISGNSAQLLSIAAQCLRWEFQLVDRNKQKKDKEKKYISHMTIENCGFSEVGVKYSYRK